MPKHLIAPLLLFVFVAISGSSCHDTRQDDQAIPPNATGGSGRIIPPQQRMPSTMPRPRM
ncbi:hypothetical protein K9857_04470 [Pseudomonas sp. REP124]|uniref:hypothetical protein n=1 Tax=Pseudomonas sp. REP124 TaxID=2875731 RepID=UPI001CCA4578|nr:hypothetical protein [Pseudomonas sp. REP124]MBZ9780807.1 hypothetical protein [Pseudomonas sp. REP124]